MQVGFVGLGNVGAKLAGSLLGHGHRLRIRDLDREAATELLAAGAIWADSGRELAEASEVVITCLPSPVISAQVLEEADGVLEGLGEGLFQEGLFQGQSIPGTVYLFHRLFRGQYTALNDLRAAWSECFLVCLTRQLK